MANLPTGTVTFLFTDIEGSTPLWEHHPQAMRVAVARHHAILRDAIEANHGRVFNIAGDAFCAAFATANDALAAALAAQRALCQADWGQTPIHVRMGLHTGEAETSDGDYRSGPTLNRVARVMSIAYGGQILLSQITAGLVRRQLPDGVSLREMGEHRLKGLADLERILQVVVPDLLTDFPPLKSLSTVPNNLPVQLTSFIGREREMTEVKRLLTTTRLLTLTGSGGTGKTRLSLHVAADLLAQFADGAWFVELAPLSDPELVPQTVATALSVREQPGRPIQTTLVDHLRDRHLLLMLDNCEHLIEASARFADTLLHAAPQLKILASSREALGIGGEAAYHVPSLPSPNPVTPIPVMDLSKYDAVRLFVERAAAAKSSFTLNDANAQAVAQVCFRLDGIPLAIELAASRTKVFSVDQIAVRLDDRFRLLTGGSRTALPRQQTLRALIDWSYGLLSEAERILLRRLSVFAGGWMFDAAETICAGAGIDSVEILDLLTHLVEKSLVVTGDEADEVRYRMLETIRQYAREKLLESSEGQALHDQHLDYFVKLGAEAEPKMRGKELGEWLDRLEAEIDNIRAALGWSQETGRTEAGLSLAASLFWFWSLRFHQTEALEWLQILLAQPSPVKNTVARGSALNALAMTHFRRGNYRTGRALAGEALEIGQELDDQQLVASTYARLAQIDFYAGNLALSQSMREQSLTLWQTMGDHYQIANTTIAMGTLAAVQGEYARAEKALAEGFRLMQEFGDNNVLSFAARFWGYALLFQGNDQVAGAKFRESLLLNWELRDRQGVGACFGAYASLALVREDFRRTGMLLGATDRVCESLELTLLPFDLPFYERCVSTAHAQLGSTAFHDAWQAGHVLTFEQAMTYALKETDD